MSIFAASKLSVRVDNERNSYGSFSPFLPCKIADTILSVVCGVALPSTLTTVLFPEDANPSLRVAFVVMKFACNPESSRARSVCSFPFLSVTRMRAVASIPVVAFPLNSLRGRCCCDVAND